MSRPPNSIHDICMPSHQKRFTLSVQAINHAILYDSFIVCLEVFCQHLKLAVFDRITSKEISALEILIPPSKVFELVRLHNWSVGFWTYEDDRTSRSDIIFHFFLHPFSIDQVGHLEKLTPILLLSSPIYPMKVHTYTSLAKNNVCVMVFSVHHYYGDDNEFEHVYDISGTGTFINNPNDFEETIKFPVVNAPTLIIKEGSILFLTGRALWVQQNNYPGADEYDLSTGAIVRTLKLEYLPSKVILYRNRFCVFSNRGKLRIMDIFTGESKECYFPQSEKIECCDVSDDGFVLFKTYQEVDALWRLTNRFITCRIEVPSLSDVAKECINENEKLALATPSNRPLSSSSTTSRQVFLRGVAESNGGDDRIINALHQKIGNTSKFTHHRLPSQFHSPNSPRPLILTFDCPEDAGLFLKSLYAVKKTGESLVASLTARMNYAKEELEQYRRLWKEAIRLNNQAGARIATVRELKLVRLETPGTWKEHPRL